MRHGILKTKFGGGKDANDMLIRKLSHNFLTHGSIKTTQAKAKVLKRHIERIVEKMKEKNEANTNMLKRHLASEELIEKLYEQIPAAMGDIKGGYVRVEKLQIRYSDGAPMARLSWTRPVVIEMNVDKAKIEAVKNKNEQKAKAK